MSKEQLSNAQLKKASWAALASLLNLSLLPGIGFLILLVLYRKSTAGDYDNYYAIIGIKTNLTAAVVLILVSGLMVFLGGFDSPWTWVYVISYFVMVHTAFIMHATWALVRSWSGDKGKLWPLS